MNRKAEFTSQGMILGILSVGLLMGVFGTWIASTTNYDTTGFDLDQINSYNKNQNLSQTLQTVQEQVDGVTVNEGWFDYFSGIFSKLLAPFKYVYRSFSYVITIANQASDLFKLMPIFREYFTSVIITLVIVGVVLYKFHLGKQK